MILQAIVEVMMMMMMMIALVIVVENNEKPRESFSDPGETLKLDAPLNEETSKNCNC